MVPVSVVQKHSEVGVTVARFGRVMTVHFPPMLFLVQLCSTLTDLTLTVCLEMLSVGV